MADQKNDSTEKRSRKDAKAQSFQSKNLRESAKSAVFSEESKNDREEIVAGSDGTFALFRRQLQQAEMALLRGERAALFRHSRWHYLTLGVREGETIIKTLNFLSPARAEALLTDWLAHGACPTPFADLGPGWAAEVAEKVLPTASAYHALLLAGQARLVTGQTTDTLWVVADEAAWLDQLTQMMETGRAGPYVRFIL